MHSQRLNVIQACAKIKQTTICVVVNHRGNVIASLPVNHQILKVVFLKNKLKNKNETSELPVELCGC